MARRHHVCLTTPDRREGPVFIYALCEPDSGVIRYIGKSAAPAARLAAVLSCGPRGSGYGVKLWALGLIRAGRRPVQRILHQVQPGQDAASYERWFISLLENSGTLLNIRGLHGRKGPLMRCRFCFQRGHDGRRCRNQSPPAPSGNGGQAA
jgi:hypothetical protein